MPPTTASRRSTALVPVLVLLVALVGAGCKGKVDDAKAPAAAGDAAKPPEAVAVEVASAQRRAVSASYSGTAALAPIRSGETYAKTSGTLLSVSVKEGDHVRAGQPIARLSTDRAVVDVERAQVNVRRLEANYARAQQLAEQRMVSASELDQIRYDLQAARVALKSAQLELSFATVRAPISGVVSFVRLKPGNFLPINNPFLTIVDISRLEATLNVPERQMESLRSGMPVAMTVDALPGQSFEGVIDRIAPMVDSGSGTFRVVCSFANDGLLQPGMFGRIAIAYDQRANAMVVPRAAVLEDDAQPAVFVVRDGKADRVPLKLGHVDGEWAEVVEGIKDGEQVVVAGKAALRDGSPVKLIARPASSTTAGQ